MRTQALRWKPAVLPLVLLFLASCGGDKGGTKPQTGGGACWDDSYEVIPWTLFVYEPDASGDRMVDLIYAGPFDPNDPPSVTLRIGGQAVGMQWTGNNAWFASVRLNAGQTYRFELTVKGQRRAADLRIAYTPVVVFPPDIVAGQGARVTWTVGGQGGCQIVNAGSGEYEDDDEWFLESVDLAAREYTFPAGCVRNWGEPTTELMLMVVQRNRVVVQDVLMLSDSRAIRVYPSRNDSAKRDICPGLEGPR